jgi:hypothetical protein
MKTIQENLKSTFQVYIDGLEKNSEEEFNYKASEEIWSLAQMHEHVYGSGYTFFLANINSCLDKRKGQIGGELTDSGSYILYKDGFSSTTKYKHPNHKKGNGPEIIGQSIQVYKEVMPELLNALLDIISKTEEDSGDYKTEHFVFGWLNAKQWLQNSEYHIRHHIKQMKELVRFYEESKAGDN